MEIELPVRRYLTYAPEGVEQVEANFRYEEKTLHIEGDQTALVLVDCWDDLYINTSYLERATKVVRELIVPLVDFCRKEGIPVIHAPNPNLAGRYQEFMENQEDWDRNPAEPDWPPKELRERTGRYAELRWSLTPVLESWYDYSKNRMMIIRELEPRPGDFMVATGDQLHALLRNHRILHLLYAGFATNFCLPNKNYGIRAMSQRGYNVVMLRDANTAVETHETYKSETLKETSILNLEITPCFSLTCTQFQKAWVKSTSAAAAV